MKKWLTALLCGFAACAAAGDPGPREWTLQYCSIVYAPPDNLGNSFKAIGLDPTGLDSRTVDLIGEYLLQFAADPRIDGGDAAILIAALARRGDGRLRLALEKLRDSNAAPAIKIAAREYLVKNRKGDAYVPGTIDFLALRRQAEGAPLSFTPTEEFARKLGTLHKGDSLERMFALVGVPHHARVIEVTKIRRMLFYYRGAGRVVFGFVDGKGWLLQSVTADSLAFEPDLPYRRRAAELGQPDDPTLRMIMLASGRWMPVKVAVDASYDAPDVTLESLDTAAEYLAQNWRSVNDDTEDTYAWIIRVLLKRGGPRYSKLLDEIADGTRSLKLRKWARLNPFHPSVLPPKSYVVGTVSLDDMARKYPALYPDVRYTSGRL
jgi:hypothetical protein